MASEDAERDEVEACGWELRGNAWETTSRNSCMSCESSEDAGRGDGRTRRAGLRQDWCAGKMVLGMAICGSGMGIKEQAVVGKTGQEAKRDAGFEDRP